MRVIVCRDQTALKTVGADEIAAVVGAKPTAAIVLATGNSPMGIYSELGARTARGQFDATQLRIFQLDEYFGLADNDKRSLFGWMDREFLQPMRVPLQNVVRLRSGDDWRAECRSYDQAVDAAGGFDLAVLGLGPNGHLAYNEPGAHAHSPTQAVLLSEASLASSAEYWGGRQHAPLAGITCGMTHLLAARQILLVVNGEKKRDILERALSGPISPEVPASYLQTVSDKLILLCDEAAAPRSALTDSDTEHGGTAPVSSPSVSRSSASERSLVLGVDGGNSKTVAFVAQKNGRILGYGRGGCGDMYGASPQGALHSVETAVQAALSLAGVSADQIETAAFSMAGADWPEDYRLLESLFARYAPKITLVNDSVGALRAGSPESWGVGIVCGSWVATAARARQGPWTKSIWHPPGGGGGLAQDALTAVYRAELGLGPQTELTQAVLSFFKQDNVVGLAHQFTKREGPHPQALQRLAPAVLDAAQSGDAVATALLVRQGNQLGALAVSMARQVGIDRKAFPLVLAGGIFRHPCQLLPSSIVATVRTQAPRVQVFRSDLEPVAGAVMLAIELAGSRCRKPVRNRLRATMPDRSFFAT